MSVRTALMFAMLVVACGPWLMALACTAMTSTRCVKPIAKVKLTEFQPIPLVGACAHVLGVWEASRWLRRCW